MQSTSNQPRGKNTSGVHIMSDSRAVQSNNAQVRRKSIARSHNLSDDRVVQSTSNQFSGDNNAPYDTLGREIRELDCQLLEHHTRSNEETYRGSTYHNSWKDGSNPKIRKEGSEERTSNVVNAIKGNNLFPT